MANRLANETSPYLRQHAENPVDWYPWGEEALARAQELDRPILLSIGYSACHWCHVMERESFEDDETAQLMNELFVNVKVDREERPDVDQIYMRAVQSMTGSGGWPLTAILTPDARPFFGGTYFPPVPRHRMPSFQDVLRATARAYRDRRTEVDATAAKITEMLERSSGLASDEQRLDYDLVEDAVRRMGDGFDRTHGGFGGAPKFPQPVVLDLLLLHHGRTADPEALEMAAQTLEQMARGGIHDQLTGGFHRYSVDAYWLVPHFEKMLYDNALLARCYVDAWRHTGRAEFRSVAEQTLDWMITDLGAPEGGFYSAWDADSEGVEGLYYVWTRDEVAELLGADADLFCRAYDVSAEGNFEGKNILHLPRDLPVVAEAAGVGLEELEALLQRSRNTLIQARSARVAPGLDDKVLTSWNGMALRALSEGAGAWDLPRFRDAARRLAKFLLATMRVDGELRRVWDGHSARVPAFLEDYASLGLGLLSLHATTLDPDLLDDVRWCAEQVLERFWDQHTRAFYDTARDGEQLIVRPREIQDSATPSGNALAMELVLQAGRLFEREEWVSIAEDALSAVAPLASQYPLGFGRLLAVADLATYSALEVAVVGDSREPETQALLSEALSRPLPGRLLVGALPDGGQTVPLLRDRPARDGAPTAYVCRNHTCSAPVTKPEELAALLESALAG